MKEKLQAILMENTKLITEKAILLQKIEEEPQLILTDLFNPSSYQPFYEAPFYLLGMIETSNYHTFQRYLVELITPLIKKIDDRFETKLAQPNSYPSSVQILLEETEIATFSFYNHQFKITTRFQKERMERNMEQLKAAYQRAKKQYQDVSDDYSQPKRNVHGFKEYLFYLKYKKKYMRSMERQMNEYNQRMNDEFKSITTLEDQMTVAIEKDRDLQPIYDKVTAFFSEIQYTKEQPVS